jgi:transposase
VEDESELALLPTLTRCWTRRGHQRQIPAPGKNRKRHLFVAVDWRDGTAVRRYSDRRNARTFCELGDALVWRSRRRKHRAIIVLDNAWFHRPDKSRQVADLLQRHGPWLTLVFLPAYSPELQPLDHLFRVWRSEVTHNHHRTGLDMLEADSEAFFNRCARYPQRILRTIGSPFRTRVFRRRIHVA